MASTAEQDLLIDQVPIEEDEAFDLLMEQGADGTRPIETEGLGLVAESDVADSPGLQE